MPFGLGRRRVEPEPVGAETNIGRRRVNADSSLAARIGGRRFLLAVADGVGETKGRSASETAVETVGTEVPKEPGQYLLRGEHAHVIWDRILQQAHAKVQTLKGRYTTLTAAHVTENALSGIHAGDSRAYLLREGVLTQLTEDHPQEIRDSDRVLLGLRLASAKHTAHYFERELKPGDILLLSTDGLQNLLKEERIREILERARKKKNAQEAARMLVEEANKEGRRKPELHDNITAVVYFHEPSSS
jgi:protein phosphatase